MVDQGINSGLANAELQNLILGIETEPVVCPGFIAQTTHIFLRLILLICGDSGDFYGGGVEIHSKAVGLIGVIYEEGVGVVVGALKEENALAFYDEVDVISLSLEGEGFYGGTHIYGYSSVV
jgi:hypothetical protein